MVIDREAEVIDRNVLVAGYPLLQQSADLDGLGMPGAQDLDDLVQGPPGIHNVLDDHDIAAGDVGRQVANQPDVARGLRPRPVGGDLEKIQRNRGGPQLFGEVAEEEDGTLQDPDEQDRTPVLVAVDLRSEAGNALFESPGVDQGWSEFHAGVDCGGPGVPCRDTMGASTVI